MRAVKGLDPQGHMAMERLKKQRKLTPDIGDDFVEVSRHQAGCMRRDLRRTRAPRTLDRRVRTTLKSSNLVRN